ncbi:hypothetical protein WMF01_12255 [Sorangium sp. So ce1667]
MRAPDMPTEVAKLTDFGLLDHHVQVIRVYCSGDAGRPRNESTFKFFDWAIDRGYLEARDVATLKRFISHDYESPLTSVGSLGAAAQDAFDRYIKIAPVPSGDAELREQWNRENQSGKGLAKWLHELEQKAKRERDAASTLDLIHKDAKESLRKICKRFASTWNDSDPSEYE